MTEAQAWRTVGEAFEARAAHPELEYEVTLPNDLAWSGICAGLSELFNRDAIAPEVYYRMEAKAMAETKDPANLETARELRPDIHWLGSPSFLYPRTTMPGGAELRATLAYLFAEEARA